MLPYQVEQEKTEDSLIGLKFCKASNWHARVWCPVKISFKNKGKIKLFQQTKTWRVNPQQINTVLRTMEGRSSPLFHFHFFPEVEGVMCKKGRSTEREVNKYMDKSK